MSTTEDKKTRARKWVNGYTMAGTSIVIAAVIPGTTSTALAAMEGHMCYQIGKIYRGENYTLQEAIRVARVVGLVAIAAPMVALEAMNAIPVAGWAVKGAVAGGVIKTLGEAIITRYENMEKEEANAASMFMPPAVESPALAQSAVDERLQKLTDLVVTGLISHEEYHAKRQQILSEI